MTASVQFDETNIALLEALRVNVRAPWEVVGKAIGINGVTARRRWNRILERRLAWTTVSTGNWPGQLTAIVTAHCRAGEALACARALAQTPFAVTVETLIGRQDVRATVVVEDMRTLDSFLSAGISSIPGLISIESQLVDKVYIQGSNWRPGALSRSAERALHLSSTDGRAYLPRSHTIDAALVELLVDDARAPAKSLADHLGVSETLVRRRINSLLNSGLVVLGAEAAPHLVGIPFSANYWYSFSPSDLDAGANMLSTLPESRWTVSVVASPANLFCVFWFRELSQLQELERTVHSRYPDAVIVDRSMRLQPVKRMMHVLDDDGLSSEVIPWVPRANPRN